MFSLLTSLLSASTVSLLAATPSKPPKFDCTDGNGNNYKIWLGRDQNRMLITEKGNKREILLSGENMGRDQRGPNDPKTYSGWNKKGGADTYKLFDLSTEFTTQYIIQDGNTRLKVALVVDHQERTGLACKASGVSVTVSSMETDFPAAKRLAGIVVEASSLRARNGTSTPFAIMSIETAFRRMFNSTDFAKLESRNLFIESLGPSLKMVDLRSIHKIEERLPPPVGEFFKSVLAAIQYDIFPVVNRYSNWVKEGARPEPLRSYDSLIAGFDEFVGTPGFKDKDIQAFFVSEVSPSMKNLTEEEMQLTSRAMNEGAGLFFSQVWAKAMGKRSLADVPMLSEMVDEIAAVVDAPEFDPQAFHRKVAAFLKSSMAQDAELRKLFVQAATVQAKRLTLRQREDVTGWIEEDEKAFFQQLMR